MIVSVRLLGVIKWRTTIQLWKVSIRFFRIQKSRGFLYAHNNQLYKQVNRKGNFLYLKCWYCRRVGWCHGSSHQQQPVRRSVSAADWLRQPTLDREDNHRTKSTQCSWQHSSHKQRRRKLQTGPNRCRRPNLLSATKSFALRLLDGRPHTCRHTAPTPFSVFCSVSSSQLVGQSRKLLDC